MEPAYTILLPGVAVSSRRGALGWCNVVLLRRGGKNILARTVVPGHDRPFTLLDDGGVRCEQDFSVQLDLYGDPSQDPQPVTLAPKAARPGHGGTSG